MMRTLLATSVLVVTLLSMASGASAAPAPFYGLVGGKFDPTAAEFKRMGDGRVGSVRANFAWASVQTDGPGAPYDWSRYDALVGDAAQNGVKVLATFYGTPSWVAARPNFPPPASRIDEFEGFMRAAVERYGPNGAFWTLNPLIPKIPITEWQLFNESNSPTFWLPKPKAKQYRPLLAAANRAVKGADPSATLILAGLFMTPRVKNGVTLEKYLTDLYRLKTRSLFDAVAVHPYAPTPRRVMVAIEDTREIMRKFNDRKKPIYLTEVGWASAGQSTPLTVKLKVQAKYLLQTYGMAAAKRKQLKIAGVYWYTFRDLPGPIWIDNTGLFKTSGAAKPSWRAFVRLTGGSP